MADAEVTQDAALDRVRALAQSWSSLPGKEMSAEVDRRLGEWLLRILDIDHSLEGVRIIAEGWMRPGNKVFCPAAGQAVLDALRGASTEEAAGWRSRAEAAEAELARLRTDRDLIIRWQDVRKGDLLLYEESFAVVEKVRVTADDEMDGPYVGVSYRYLGDRRSYHAACHGNRPVAVRRGSCGQCNGGLVDVPGCNRGGGGPDGIPPHEPLCGAGPCPNGCWDRLHPAVAEGGGNG